MMHHSYLVLTTSSTPHLYTEYKIDSNGAILSEQLPVGNFTCIILLKLYKVFFINFGLKYYHKIAVLEPYLIKINFTSCRLR